MNNEECVELFEKYLTDEKHSSANTLSSYMRDIRQLAAYIDEHTELTLTTVTADELSEYIEWLRGKGKSVATVSRSIASIKCLYAYLCIHRYIDTNPQSLSRTRGRRSSRRSLRVRKSTSCLTSRNALT